MCALLPCCNKLIVSWAFLPRYSLTLFRKNFNLKLAELYFHEMEHFNLTRSVKTYSALITAYEKAGQWESALLLLNKMKQGGQVQPNVVSYNAVMLACGKAGQWQHIASLLNAMKSEGVKPDAVTYGTMISACKKVGQCEVALLLLNHMKLDGVAPNVVAYNAAILACGKAARWDDIDSLLKDMKLEGIEPDAVTYHTMIEAYANSGRWKEVNETFQKALSMELWPNHAKYEGETFVIDLQGFSLTVAKEILKHYLLNDCSNIIDIGDTKKIFVLTGHGSHLYDDNRRGILQREVGPFISKHFGLCVKKMAGNNGGLLVYLNKKRF